jgi:hypothetical protein
MFSVRVRERLSAAALSFYRDVLGGRQVWPDEARHATAKLWFLVGSTLVDVDIDGTDSEPIELIVEQPNELADRCWDAGYTVQVRGDDEGDSLSVIDPLGRRIDLVPRQESQQQAG